MNEERLECVSIEVTKLCNFKCCFCFAGSNQTIKESICVPHYKLCHIRDEVIKENIRKVTLTGGEPLMDKSSLMWFINELPKHGIALNLNTNLSMIDGDFLDSYISNVGKDIYIFTSLLSPCREICDSMTGVSGSFSKIIKGIVSCHEKGLKVSVNFTIGNDNFRDLERIIDFSSEHKLDRVSISLVIPPFYDRNNKLYRLEVKQIKKLAETLVSIHERLSIPVASSHPIPLCIVGNDPRYAVIERGRCQTGTRYCAINLHTGSVFACSQECKNYGNIYKEGLHNCWDKMRKDHGLNILKHCCRHCGMLEQCGGECKWSGSIIV